MPADEPSVNAWRKDLACILLSGLERLVRKGRFAPPSHPLHAKDTKFPPRRRCGWLLGDRAARPQPASGSVVRHVQLATPGTRNSAHPGDGAHGAQRGSLGGLRRRRSPDTPLALPQRDGAAGSPNAFRFCGRIAGESHRAGRRTVSDRTPAADPPRRGHIAAAGSTPSRFTSRPRAAPPGALACSRPRMGLAVPYRHRCEPGRRTLAAVRTQSVIRLDSRRPRRPAHGNCFGPRSPPWGDARPVPQPAQPGMPGLEAALRDFLSATSDCIGVRRSRGGPWRGHQHRHPGAPHDLVGHAAEE